MTTLSVSFAEQTGRVGRGGGAAYAKGMDVDRIFVGNLPEDASEEELMFRFQECGVIQGANLLPSKSHKRCGYVSFQVWGEAMDAVEKMHGQPLRATTEHMTVVLAQPKDGGAARAAAAAFSRSGPDLSKLGMDLMSSLGNSLGKKRRMDSQPGGGGGVDLTVLLAAYAAAVNSEGPRSACDILHEQLMQARDQSRMPSFSLRDPGRSAGGNYGGSRDGDRDTARLFIGGLPHECEDEDLAALANQLQFSVPPYQSTLLECRVLPGKGCGYLKYPSWEAAEEAFNALQGRQVEGWLQVLRVQWASPRDGRSGAVGGAMESPMPTMSVAPMAQPVVIGQPQASLDPICYASEAEVVAQALEPTRLFIGQIARDVQDANISLRPVFESFGPLIEFRWVKEKGVLYVTYNTHVEAQAAMQGLASRAIQGISKCLNVKFSTRRHNAH